MPIQLTTERLLLRPLVQSDFEAVHTYASDPEVCHYMNFGPNTEEETRVFLRASAQGWAEEPPDNYEFAVTLRGNGDLIGTCGLHLGPFRRAEIGYIYRREAWGQGYGTEAARAVVDFGFRQLGLHRVQARHDAPNVASGRIMQRLGMTCEGRFREAVYRDGEWHDVLLYGILEEEWRAGQLPGPADHAHPGD